MNLIHLILILNQVSTSYNEVTQLVLDVHKQKRFFILYIETISAQSIDVNIWFTGIQRLSLKSSRKFYS